MKKNVYQGYLSSAGVRSSSERKIEKFCEKCDAVEWVYKNGDKGNEYLSIVYVDNSDKQKNSYPDYIISVNGEVWIVESKGGFDRSGNSQDIDIFTPKKFTVLKDYLERYSLNEYSRAVTPQIRQAGNRLSGLAETAYASLLA